MAFYSLRHDRSQDSWHDTAANRDEALRKFEQRLGMKLTFENDNAFPEIYVLAESPTAIAFQDYSIPVYGSSFPKPNDA